jgi:CRP-like cAMP-binding protein
MARAQPLSDLGAILTSGGVAQTIARYRAGQVIFSEGDASDSIIYLQEGIIKLSVFSNAGREGVVALLRSGDFFGDECLVGQRRRTRNATASTLSIVLVIDKADMARLLRTQQALRRRFIEHLGARTIALEADLVDLRVSYCTRRLARKLLLLNSYGKPGQRFKSALPSLSQSTLAAMIGTSRSRTSSLMANFMRLGFIAITNGKLTVRRSLRRVLSNRSSRGASQHRKF